MKLRYLRRGHGLAGASVSNRGDVVSRVWSMDVQGGGAGQLVLIPEDAMAMALQVLEKLQTGANRILLLLN